MTTEGDPVASFIIKLEKQSVAVSLVSPGASTVFRWFRHGGNFAWGNLEFLRCMIVHGGVSMNTGLYKCHL